MFEVILSSFFWFLDALICFIVSSVIVSVFLCICVLVFQWIEGPVRRSDFWALLTHDQRLSVCCIPGFILAVCVFCRSIYLSWWKDEEHLPLKFSSTLVGCWLPIFRNYYLDVYPVSIFVNKLYLFACLLLFVPLCAIAVGFLNHADKPILQSGLWVIDRYHKWTRTDKDTRIRQCIYYEWTEKQYLKAIVGASFACMEKQEELDVVEKEAQSLRKENAKLNKQLKKERDRNQNLKRKLEEQKKINRQQERELSNRPSVKVEKKTVVSVGGANEEDSLCVICMERTRVFNLKPCNHFCVCNICKPKLQSKCPLCRKHVQRFEKVYVNAT